MSVKKISRIQQQHMLKTVKSMIKVFETTPNPQIPLACQLAHSLAENGWNTIVYPPKTYDLPTLKVRKPKQKKRINL